MYHVGMVASRGPRSRTHRPETAKEKVARILSEPRDAPVDIASKREARALLRRLYDTGDPSSSPPGDEAVKRFFGLWPEPDTASYPD
jgi:hypothetical protein